MLKHITIGSDHAGFELKEVLKEVFKKANYAFEDVGCFDTKSVDYPDYAHQVANKLNEDPNKIGIVICGSGNGINMTVNKHDHIRAALCWSNEIAEMARLHNNANVLSIPARYVSKDLAIEMVTTFLNTAFEGGRHQRRINKITV